jgi:UDP:flavonoid glycosyltransferase YjiC (YdhE family)
VAVKVLLTPVGSHGDVHPFVALGLELARRGHDVTVITNGAFRDLVARAGLAFAELGSAELLHQLLADPLVWDPVRGSRLFFGFLTTLPLRPLFEAVAGRCEFGRTLVVSPPTALGARLAQEKLGAPLVTVHMAPAALPSVYRPPRMPGAYGIIQPSWSPRWYSRLIYCLAELLSVDRIMAGPLNAFRAELGLPPVSRVISHWWNSPQLVLGLWPAWFAPPPPDWPPQVRLTGFPRFDERGLRDLPVGLDEFLRAGDPPLIFTPGSAMMHGRHFFEAGIEACRLLGRRGILLTSFHEHLPASLPAFLRHYCYVPFSEVFPRAAAVVHHGGIGTTAQGLAAGVPQLIMPLGFDQYDNAARVARLGVGASLPPRKFTGARVARALEELLQPDVRVACQEVAGRFQGENAVGAACDLIEGLAGTAAETSPASHVGRVMS